jgi:hypothetical protein
MTAIGNLNNYVKYNMGNALAGQRRTQRASGAEMAAVFPWIDDAARTIGAAPDANATRFYCRAQRSHAGDGTSATDHAPDA